MNFSQVNAFMTFGDNGAMIRTVFRGDDAGSCVSANEAICEAARFGVLRNVSVMACGPALAHAAELLRSLDVCLGLHVTLSSEWERVKWGPVADVPDLVEPDGSFTADPGMLNKRGFNLDQAMIEVRAQLARLRWIGLAPQYLDEHMGVGWLPGFRDALIQFCQEEGLLAVCTLGLPYLSAEEIGKKDGVFVTHPGRVAEDMIAMTLPGMPEGQIANERDADRRLLLDSRLREFNSITYLEAA